MARPRKGEEIGAGTHIGVRVTSEMREALEAMAADNARSITDEVRAAIEAHVAREKRRQAVRLSGSPLRSGGRVRLPSR